MKQETLGANVKDRFPVAVKHTLRRAGWIPGRAVHVRPLLHSWQSLELEAKAGPLDFVSEFDGLLVHHPPFVDVGDQRHFDRTMFNVVNSVSGVSARPYKDYAQLAKVDLYPVGRNRSHMTLIAGLDRKLYLGVDNFLSGYPGDLESALVSICSGLPATALGEWKLLNRQVGTSEALRVGRCRWRLIPLSHRSSVTEPHGRYNAVCAVKSF